MTMLGTGVLILGVLIRLPLLAAWVINALFFVGQPHWRRFVQAACIAVSLIYWLARFYD